MANPIVTSLPAYVEEHILPLIGKSVLGAKSTKMFNLLTGVKGATALNLVATDVQLQSAMECGFTESGTTELSQRIMDAKPLKVNHTFCDKQLLNTWASYQVRLSAGDKELPFEEEFVGQIVDGVNEQVEKMLYQGQKGQVNECEGLISILTDASAPTATATGAYEAIKAVYMAMPEAVVSKEDAVILVSDGAFRAFIQDLVSANLYHFNPNDKDGEYLLPGTNTRVIAVSGLNGTDKVIGGRLSNIFYGTDMQGDEEKFSLWYSMDDQVFKLVIEFSAGVQVAYPDEVVLGTIA